MFQNSPRVCHIHYAKFDWSVRDISSPVAQQFMKWYVNLMVPDATYTDYRDYLAVCYNVVIHNELDPSIRLDLDEPEDRGLYDRERMYLENSELSTFSPAVLQWIVDEFFHRHRNGNENERLTNYVGNVLSDHHTVNGVERQIAVYRREAKFIRR